MDSQGHDIQSPGAGRTVEGLAGRRILLGITGSIAAYKAAVLCRLLKCAGAEVRVVMTPLAKQFITPLTMATLSKNPILVEFFDPENGAWNSHVSLGEWADCYLIAPATANTLAKMACGIADNLLLTTYLSARCPVVVSPAMDLDMYAHPATQENLRRLAERGVRIVQPAEGELASGLTGKGRMAEPADIAAFVGQLLGGENPEKKKSLQGRRFVVTAGATIEAIDPVRFISNHSSGKMGYAIARAAAMRGAEVTLIHGQTALPPVKFTTDVPVTTARQMYEAVTDRFDTTDVLIMAAAVADYRPATVADDKIKKKEGDLSIPVERTEDILGTIGPRKTHQFLCGFSMETRDLVENSSAKLAKKNLDMVVANNLKVAGAGFGVDTNVVTFITPDGTRELPLMSKADVADAILDEILQRRAK